MDHTVTLIPSRALQSGPAVAGNAVIRCIHGSPGPMWEAASCGDATIRAVRLPLWVGHEKMASRNTRPQKCASTLIL